MPRFYFDLRQNGLLATESDLLATDEKGEELPDLVAAEREAALVATHLTAELFKGPGLKFCIDVRNDRGGTVARVSVSLDVERVGSLTSGSLTDD
jgi:hypothetical protein